MPLEYPIRVETYNPNKITLHHRLPESLGGNRSKRNISHVPLYKHRAWHILFDNLPATEIITILRGYYEIFGIDVVKSDLQKDINEHWANSNKERIKNRQAWYELFESMTLMEIVEEVNAVWLDPDYCLLIGLERVYKINLVSNKSRKGAH